MTSLVRRSSAEQCSIFNPTVWSSAPKPCFAAMQTAVPTEASAQQGHVSRVCMSSTCWRLPPWTKSPPLLKGKLQPRVAMATTCSTHAASFRPGRSADQVATGTDSASENVGPVHQRLRLRPTLTRRSSNSTPTPLWWTPTAPTCSAKLEVSASPPSSKPSRCGWPGHHYRSLL